MRGVGVGREACGEEGCGEEGEGARRLRRAEQCVQALARTTPRAVRGLGKPELGPAMSTYQLTEGCPDLRGPSKCKADLGFYLIFHCFDTNSRPFGLIHQRSFQD